MIKKRIALLLVGILFMDFLPMSCQVIYAEGFVSEQNFEESVSDFSKDDLDFISEDGDKNTYNENSMNSNDSYENEDFESNAEIGTESAETDNITVEEKLKKNS